MRTNRRLSLVVAFATAPLAACDGAATEPQPVMTSGALSLPVTITNPLSSPVPTYAVGSTRVEGTIQAAQAGSWGVTINNPLLPVNARQDGYWGVEVTNSSLDVRGTVGAEQSGAWRVGLEGTADVAVVNTPTVELAAGARVAIDDLPPVSLAGTPTVQLAGTPTVQLTGTPTVRIDGETQMRVDGDVYVANTDEAPVPVRLVGAQSTPWAKQKLMAIPDGAIGVDEVLFEVPIGKRLVIEHVDAFLILPEGQGGVAVNVTSQVEGESVQFSFPLVQTAGFGGVDRFAVAQQTKLYAEAESSVTIELVRNDITAVGNGRVTLSGYLVDAD